MNLCDYQTIRDLLARHGFHFSKSMGQNFLIDPEVPRRIAEASGAGSTCGVLEIGPGIGPLTAELAQRADKVVAVELDRALLPVLKETMAPYPNVEIVPGDVLKLDLQALAAEKFAGLTPMVCANLPYNVTSPILEKLVETPCFSSFTVMIQREVARRLCAPRPQGDLRRDPLRPAGPARRGRSRRGVLLQGDAGRLPAAAQDPGQQSGCGAAGILQGGDPAGHRRERPARRCPGGAADAGGLRRPLRRSGPRAGLSAACFGTEKPAFFC